MGVETDARRPGFPTVWRRKAAARGSYSTEIRAGTVPEAFRHLSPAPMRWRSTSGEPPRGGRARACGEPGTVQGLLVKELVRLIQHALQDGVDEPGAHGDQHHVGPQSPPFVARIVRQLAGDTWRQRSAIPGRQRTPALQTQTRRQVAPAADLAAQCLDALPRRSQVRRSTRGWSGTRATLAARFGTRALAMGAILILLTRSVRTLGPTGPVIRRRGQSQVADQAEGCSGEEGTHRGFLARDDGIGYPLGV